MKRIAYSDRDIIESALTALDAQFANLMNAEQALEAMLKSLKEEELVLREAFSRASETLVDKRHRKEEIAASRLDMAIEMALEGDDESSESDESSVNGMAS